MSALRRLLREPILHFALIGVALFTAYGWMTRHRSSGKRIVVTQVVVDGLVRQFEGTWMRGPTAEELSGLVETYVRDEILYREGLALGLDRDDPVIKRRVRQKLEVMAEEDASRGAPTDAELSAYLAAHATQFMRPPLLSFEQILLGPPGTPKETEQAVAAARRALARGADPAGLGRSTLLPARVSSMPADLVARDFGEAFARELTLLPEGEWTGPVMSGFGAHLVRVTARTPAVVPPLDEVRVAVTREWENQRRETALHERYRALRSGYDVAIEAALPGVGTP